MKKMVRALRPGGVLLLADVGKDQRVLEDEPVECWTLKWLKDAGNNFSEDVIFGEDLKTLILAEDALQFGSEKEIWINANWVDPNDPYGPEIVQIAKSWFPVSSHFLRATSHRLITFAKETLRSVTPALKKAGWTADMVRTAMQKMMEELDIGRPKFSKKLVSVWALKK